MDYEISSEIVGDILIDVYSDILYASFVYKGKRYTQGYKHGTEESEIRNDAEKAVHGI
ncbi:hypothetical protein NVP1039O_56 [Vibrio phage 1.039.O._10N.286.55.A2]|nr:hypothetical protein NVP1039O_56 [Vibrio phage 1.039.O._10N.286.55.A2]AUR84634.1 hypothetical protein NVP1061O_53 [Vibrio phage 1.061.O._10N.286.55.C2]